MLVYALVSSQARDAVEHYVRREDAQAALREALKDMPVWRGVLDVVEVELDAAARN